MPDDKIIQEINTNSSNPELKRKLLDLSENLNSLAKKVGKMRVKLARDIKLCRTSLDSCKDPGDKLEADRKIPGPS